MENWVGISTTKALGDNLEGQDKQEDKQKVCLTTIAAVCAAMYAAILVKWHFASPHLNPVPPNNPNHPAIIDSDWQLPTCFGNGQLEMVAGWFSKIIRHCTMNDGRPLPSECSLLCLTSELLYPEDTVSPHSGVAADTLRRGRDYIVSFLLSALTKIPCEMQTCSNFLCFLYSMDKCTDRMMWTKFVLLLSIPRCGSLHRVVLLWGRTLHLWQK